MANIGPDNLLEKWVNISSISGTESAFLIVLEAFFKKRGWNVERHPVLPRRWNLLIRPKNTSQDFPEVLFCTHVDTVPPHIPFRKQDGRYYGRGTCDTKGGIVAMAFAAEQLRDTHALGANIGLLLVVGEEVDHCGAMAATRNLWKCRHVILGEPTRNALVSHQKGLLKVVIRAEGIAAHSAFPHRGSSAIEILLDILQELRETDWPVHPVLGDTHLNVGLIEGGVAANVLAPSAEATVLFRLVSPAREVLSLLKEVCGSAEIEVLTRTEPLQLFVPEEGDFDTTTAAFNSDATWMRELGVVSLTGPGNIERAHSVDEYITPQELGEGILLYKKLGAHLLELPPLLADALG